jgi:hypothetical protein
VEGDVQVTLLVSRVDREEQEEDVLEEVEVDLLTLQAVTTLQEQGEEGEMVIV